MLPALSLAVSSPWFFDPGDQNPEGTRQLVMAVEHFARRSPRAEGLAESLRYVRSVHSALTADVDGDSRPDLLAAAAAIPARAYHRGPLLVFRGSDLAAGVVRPYELPSGGDFSRVDRVADVNGDGKAEVVTVYETHGTGGHVPWLFYLWEGKGFSLIFDAVEDHWRGPNDVVIGPGTVTITCRPMGAYDHKFSAHRQHTEVWVWKSDRYVMASHHAPPPPTDRQGVNDAEAYLRRQDYAEAIARYRLALRLPAETEPLWAGRDWKAHARQRIELARALLGRREAGAGELAPAPPEVALQAHLQAGRDFPAADTVTADLDGDGRSEVWVRLEDGDAFLAVKTPAGWRVGSTYSGSREKPVVQPAPGGRKRLLFASDFVTTLEWDGQVQTTRQTLREKTYEWRRPLLPPPVEPCRQPYR